MAQSKYARHQIDILSLSLKYVASFYKCERRCLRHLLLQIVTIVRLTFTNILPNSQLCQGLTQHIQSCLRLIQRHKLLHSLLIKSWKTFLGPKKIKSGKAESGIQYLFSSSSPTIGLHSLQKMYSRYQKNNNFLGA